MEEQNCYCSAILLSVCFIVLAKVFSHRKKNLPPSPLALPIIGHYYLIKNSLQQALSSISAEYGPVVYLWFGRCPIVVVSSPSGVEECLTKNDIILANRPRTMVGDIFSFNYNNMVWAQYGHIWRLQRRLCAIELFSTISLDRSSIVREEEIQVLIRSLFRVSRSGSARVEVKNWASVYAFNAMMRLVSGKRFVDEEDVGSEKGKEIIKELRRIFFPDIAILTVYDFFPVLRLFGCRGTKKKMELHQEERNKFLNGLLDDFRSTEISSFDSSSVVKNSKKATTIVKTLLSLREQEPELYTENLIKSFLWAMFVAGTESSSTTIEWAMSLLLAHPEMMQKLKSEIDFKIGHDRLVNESDLPKLPFLNCVVNETLRLYPPIPFLLPHHSTEDCEVLGFKIPKNTILMINARALHQDPEAWDEPEKFKPERFEGVEGEKDGFGYKFVPFGLGRRACPGNNMALRAVSLALAAILQVFDWENVGDDEMESSSVSKITLHRAVSLEAVCSPRPNCIPLLSQL